MTTTQELAAAAQTILGRKVDAKLERRFIDWPAAEAVRDAAWNAGLTLALDGWAIVGDVEAKAAHYLTRYEQAYGIAATGRWPS